MGVALCLGLCPLPLELGMCKCLRFPDYPPEHEWGGNGAGCHKVSNPVLTLLNMNFILCYVLVDDKSRGLALREV